MGARILLVDDEKEFAEALSERLVMRDFEVTLALSGEEAIEKVEAHPYDLAILDVSMPGMGGVETLREIKKRKPLMEVIMLTGHATVPTAIDGLKLGAFDYLTKPCETDDLVLKIQDAYKRKVKHEERIQEARIRQILQSPRKALKKGHEIREEED